MKDIEKTGKKDERTRKSEERWAKLNPSIDLALIELTKKAGDNATYFTVSHIGTYLVDEIKGREGHKLFRYDITVLPSPKLSNRLEALVGEGKALRITIQGGNLTKAYRATSDFTSSAREGIFHGGGGLAPTGIAPIIA